VRTEVLRYRDDVRPPARQLCRHREDAEDVAQPTLLKAVQHLEGIRWEASHRSWLHRITTNDCRMLRRRRAGMILEAERPAHGRDGPSGWSPGPGGHAAGVDPSVSSRSASFGLEGSEFTMKALVVIDMLNDFVTGKIANPRAERIIPTIGALLDRARADRDRWLVVYANDAHLPNDFELKVWGEHAMAGTEGAEVIPELASVKGDFVLPKRTYSSFHETGLDDLLRQFGVRTLVLTGQHTNICLRHTTADAFFRGYEVVVPRDAVEAISEEDHQAGLAYLESIYKASIVGTESLLD
jgi:nicotinamidase-related amidase